MKIDKNMVVTLNYELHSSKDKESKTYVEKTSDEHPFVFLYGNGSLLMDFEKNLHGKTSGDKFAFDIDAANAYGTFDLEAIVRIPKEAFQGPDGKVNEEVIKVGKLVPMMDNEGKHLQGKILEIHPNEVLMDFNHPLAGQNLHFTGAVISVRPATEEEIAHGHVHDGTHHH